MNTEKIQKCWIDLFKKFAHQNIRASWNCHWCIKFSSVSLLSHELFLMSFLKWFFSHTMIPREWSY